MLRREGMLGRVMAVGGGANWKERVVLDEKKKRRRGGGAVDEWRTSLSPT